MAHRTSPTNIGLYLLSTLAARDFGMGWDAGYRGASGSHVRHHGTAWNSSADIFTTGTTRATSVRSTQIRFLGRQRKYGGHLLALANGCRELIQKSSIDSAGARWEYATPCELLREALEARGDTRRTHTVTRKQLSNALDALAASLDAVPADAVDWACGSWNLRERAQTVADIAQTLAQELGDGTDSELRAWADAARSLRREPLARRQKS